MVVHRECRKLGLWAHIIVRPTVLVMCNAYNLRHREAAILDIARAMQLPLADLPEFPPHTGSASAGAA